VVLIAKQSALQQFPLESNMLKQVVAWRYNVFNVDEDDRMEDSIADKITT